MKDSIFRSGFCLGLLAMVLMALSAVAQMPGPGANSAMIKLFGDNLAFTSRATIQVAGSNRMIWLQMPSTFSGADTKLRVDVDLNQLQSRAVDPKMIAHYKQVGLDRVTSVIRPDRKTTYIIYPGVQSYANMPLSEEDAQVVNQKLEKKPLGKETVDGHPCVKNLSTVKSPKGTVLIQAVTWNATDLKDFPVQIQTQENGNTTMMHFQQVSLVKPTPGLFEPPSGYRKFGDAEDLRIAAENKNAPKQATPAKPTPAKPTPAKPAPNKTK